MKQRSGYTLAELVVVLPLGLLLVALVLAGLIAQSRLAHRVAELAGRAEAERIAATLLPEELRWAHEQDLRSESPDSVRARIFRGYGIPCAGDPAVVRWFGVRAPDPGKDSLLIVGAVAERAVRLTGAARHEDCGGYVLQADAPLEPGLLLLFETGTYYLRERALRFRAGAEGRQPLTGEWFNDGRTALLPDTSGAPRGARLAIRAVQRGGALEVRDVRWTLPNAGGLR